MSMDLFLQNNPDLRPRDEVRLERVTASAFPDRLRVKIEVEITPFRERPNLEIALLDSVGRPVAEASAVAVMNFSVAFVLHIRGVDDPAGDYTARVQLYFDDAASPQDQRDAPLTIPAA